MWVFITARIRQWLFFAIALPVLTLLVHVLRQAIERRSGQTRLTKVLAQIEDLGRRGKRKKA